MLDSLAPSTRPTARLPITRPMPQLPLGAFSPATGALAPRVPAPERDPLSPLARCMAHMLDEIDYGMLLVDADGRVLYLNHAARRELDEHHPLQLAGQQLGTAQVTDAGMLQEALAQAQRGRRQLLTLGSGEHFVGVSVVPLDESEGVAGPWRTTLLMLGKRQVCEQLTVQGYARSVGLTPAGTRVLEMLCGGVKPTAIAEQQGVAVSTVRTQIGSIRAKTGTGSIRELVRQVAVLPPLVGVLRCAMPTFARVPLAA